MRLARPVARVALALLLAVVAAPAALAQVCAAPGSNGVGSVSGIVNTYYPGTASTLAAGSTSVAVGTADSRGSAVPVAAGDLLLVIQVQDASISSTNSSAYGGSGGGSGYTALGSSGLFEYVVATGPVSLGSIPIATPLANTYRTAAANATSGQKRYQVIRVPQYSSATLTGTVTAPPWDGSSGGLVAFDVAGNLNWAGQVIDVAGRGFRGGGAQCSTSNGTGTAVANTDYRTPVGTGTINLGGTGTVPNGAKGEGIAGTPILVFTPTTPGSNAAGVIDNTGGTDGSSGGYPSGSFGRGAPGNGGGGGTDGNPTANDQNTGGGGGGNYGIGGKGGFGWTPGTPPGVDAGGFGGMSVPSAANRLFFGGGGGSGTTNNCTGTPANGRASSGAAGGGLVLVRAGRTSGTVTVNAQGTNGNSTITNDASGGGGAGGSVLIFVDNSGGAVGANINVQGGNGGSNTGGGAPHGPGGGGSGGFAITSGPAGGTVNVAGGASGTTATSPTSTADYGSSSSVGGFQIATLAASQIPGAGSSTACFPQLTVTKSTSTPFIAAGAAATWTITATNLAGRSAATGVSIADVLPASPNITYLSTNSITLAGGATRTAVADPAPGATTPAWGTFSIPGGGGVTISFQALTNTSVPSGTVQNPASVTYLDPTRTAAQTVTPGGTYTAAGLGTVGGSNYAAASSTAEDVNVVNPPPAITKSFSPGAINVGQPSVLTVSIANASAIALTNVTLTDTYPAGLVNTAAPNGTSSCGGTVNAAPSGTGFSLTGASIGAGGSCTITVNVTITATGAYTNTIPIAALGNAQGITNTAAATATLFSNVTVAKSFSPTAVAPNANATLSLVITNPNGIALGLANPGLTDAFPANLVATGGAVTVAGAGCTSFAPATIGAGATSLVLTAGTLPANASCTVTLAVRSSVAGIYNNTTGGVTTIQTGTTGPPSNTASLGVGLINIAKQFSPNTILAGGNTSVVYTLTNPTGVAQTGGTFLDSLINMTVAAPGTVSSTCPAFSPASFAAGATALSFTGITIPAGSCTITVPITSNVVGAQPNATNGVTTAALPQGPGSNTDILNVLAKPTIAKSFAPATVAPGANATLTLTITNPGPIALTGASLTDTYPAGLVNATPLAVGGTCTGVTTTASAGGNTFNVTAATIPAASSCTITVAVTAAAAGSYANTASGVATTQTGSAGTGSNTATLAVAAAPSITKAFGTSPISQGGTSVATFTITNANTIALTNVRFTDALANMSVASTTIGGTCAGTTNTPALVVGATSLDLTVPSIAAGASCTVTVTLTSSVSGTQPNTTSGVTSTQTPAAGAPSNTANLVVLSPPTMQKNFVPGTIQAGGTTSIVFTLANPNAAALSNVQWSDTLSNMALGTAPAVTKTCTGTVSSAGVSAGSVNFNLTLNTLAAGETCTVTVSPVTSSTVSPTGGHPNTTSTVTSTQTPSGGAAATGFLNVVVSPTLTKSFSPNTVTSGAPNSLLTFTLTNPNAVTLTDIRFTDNFPANVRTRAIAQNFIGAGRGTCTGTIPSAQGATNQTSLSFSSTNLAPGASCTITVDIEVTANGTYTNTTTGPIADQAPTAGTPATDVITRGIVGITKAFSPNAVAVNGTSTLTFTISNNSGGNRSGLAFTDTFPGGLVAVGGTVTLATVSGTACSALAPTTVAANATGYNLTALTIPNNSVCTVSFAVRGTAAGVISNTVTGTAPSQFAGSTSTATLTVFATPTIAKAFAPATIPAGGTSTLTFTLTNPNAFAPLTGASFTDALANMSVASATIGGTCTGASNSPALVVGATALNLTVPTIPAGGSCTVSISVTSSIVGTLPNTASGITTNETPAAGAGSGTVNLTVAGLTLTKTFGPSTLPVGQPSTLTITITNGGGVAWSGVAFTDTLPAGLVIASPANVATTCPAGTVVATPGGTTLSLSGGSLLASTAPCSVQADVVAATPGTRTNNAASFSGLSTGVSATGANASVTHFNGPALTKAFGPTSIAPGSTSTLTFTITASAGGQAVSGLAFTDTLPAGLVVAGTPAVSNGCGGTFTASPGAGSVSLAGASLAGAPASCTISVAVTSTVLGTYTNNATNIGSLAGGLTAATVNASLSVVGTSLAKTFTPVSIGRGAASVLAFTIGNGAGNPAQSGLGFIENLPANVFVDAVPGVTNTCGGTVTAAAGAGTITLAGGSIPGGTGSCTFSVRVTSSFAGSYLNNASRIVNAPASMDTSGVNATLTVIENPTVAKAFGAASIAAGGATPLTITLSNPNGTAITGAGFTDTFPVSPGPMTLDSSSSSNTCGGSLTNAGGGALSPGDAGIRLAGGTIPAGGSCAITVNVTASVAGSYTNTLAAGAVTSGNAGANTSPASASLTVLARPTVAKSFGAAAIAVGGSTSLTVTVSNANAVPLTGLAFTDTFPVVPGAMTLFDTVTANTCGGTLADSGGGALNAGDVGIRVTGGTVPAGGSCAVTVNVTAATAGSYTNTIPAGGVSTANGGSSAALASANLGVLSPPGVAKAFAPASIFPGASTRITVTLTNSNTAAITGVAFTDNHPAGIVNAAAPAAANSCGGTVTAVAGNTSFSLSGGTIPAGGSCAVSLAVTSNQVGVYTNSTGPVATANAGTGTAATAQLTVVGEIGGTKAFSPSTIAAGGTSTLTITLQNPNTTTAVSGIAFTDTYPAGLANTGTPSVTSNCGGTVTAAANGGSLSLTGGSLAASASCTITVQVTSATPGTLTNVTGAITAANAPPEAVGLSGDLVVLARPTATKAFGAATIPPGGSTTLTVTVSNPNATPLTGLAFTDTFPTAPGAMTLFTGGSTNTCGGTLTDDGGGALNAGDAGIRLTGGTVPAGGSCAVAVNVTATIPGTYANAIPAGGVTSTNGGASTAAANASLTVLAPPTATKAFSPSVVGVGQASTLTITLSNANATAVTGVDFTDAYPAGLANSGTPALSNTCGGTATALPTGISLALTGGAIAAGGSCTVTVSVTPSSAGSLANSTGPITTANAGTGTAASANLTVLAAPTVTKAFTPASVGQGQASTLSITLANPNAQPVTGAAFTDNYPAGLVNATTPALANTCGGTATAAAGGGSLTLAGGTIPASGSCVVTVAVSAAAAGSYANSTGPVTTTNGGTAAAGGATLTVLSPLTGTKSFSPAQLGVGAATTLTVQLANANAAPVTGVGFTDTYPAGLVNAATPAASSSCGGTVTAAAGGASLALSGATIAAGGTCTISVSVTSAAAGTYANTIPAGAIVSTNAGSNAAPVTGNVSFLGAATATKSFSPSTVGAGVAATLTITISNPNATQALAGVALTDTYPAGLVNAGTPALANTCGGTATATAGGNALTLSGGSVAGGGSCSLTVQVVAGAAGSYVNGTGPITATNANAGASANATLTVLAPPVATKAFSPAVVGPGQAATLTITLNNPNATAVTGMAFTDTYPAGLVNSAAPALANTCGGTATGAAGAGSLSLAGGTLPAGAACSVSVSVESATPGTYANATGAIATANAGTGASAGATLRVIGNLAVTKAFVPPSIGVNDTSLLTITLINPNTDPVTIVGFNDIYPAGLVNAASPAATTTCPAGGVTASVGGTSLVFTGGTIPASSSCTVTVGVTSAGIGSLANSTGPVTTANAGTASAGSGTLSVLLHPTIAKAFAPAEMPLNGTSTLTLTLGNPNGATAITGASLTDAYPAGVVNTTPASIVTTCGGTATGAAGGNAVSLTGGTIPAGGSCTVTATVTSASANAYTNVVAAGGLSTTNAGSNTAQASATLSVLSPLGATKSFSPASIGTNDESLLTITFTNPNGSTAITGVGFGDTYPAGLVNSATPAVGSTCGGTVTAAPGGNSLSLSGASVPAGGSCAVTLKVTSAATGTYVNSTGPIATANAGPTGAVIASLTVLQHVTATKSFSPNPIGTGGVATLTIALTNPNATPLDVVAFTDTYPAGLVNAAAPAAATTCATGTVSAAAGAGSLTLSGGTVAANSSCTITVNVTSAAAASYTNTLAAGAITTANAGANTAPVSGTLGVFNAPTIAKSFAPATIAADGTSTITFQIGNTNPVPLTGGAFADTLANMRVNAAGAAGGTCAGAAGNVLAAGQTSLAFTGLTIPAGSSCTVTVVVTSDTPGTNPNTTGPVTTAEAPASAPSNTANLVVNAAAPTIAKAFSPASIPAAGVSTVTLTIANTNGVALTGAGFTDTLVNMRVAANQNAGGTCVPAAPNALTANQTNVAITGLTIPANGACTVTFTVTSNTAGSLPNTTSGVSSNEAPTGAGGSASLTVAVNPATIAKAFSPASIAYATGVSTLTFTITNSNAIALTGGTFTDSLSGMAVAANQSAGGTCVGASGNSFTAGATALAFSGLTVPATSSCTVSVTVNSTSVGAQNNVSGGVTTNEAGAGPVSNTATLTVTALAPTVTKSFTPSTIGNNGFSTLLVALGNPNGGPITVATAIDNFPSGIVLAASPLPATTCAGGAVSSTAGSVTLTGGTIPAGGSCTFNIDVQGTNPGTATVNTIPAGGVTTNVGANTAPASATLTVLPAADIRVTKSGPATVNSGAPITYTIVVSNFGPDAAPNSTMSDTVPGVVTGVGASCGSPTGGAACGTVNVSGNAVTSTIPTLPAGGSVTFTITGTAPPTGTFTNSVIALPPAGTADPDDPGREGALTNGASVTTAVLTVDLQVAKSHAGSFTTGSNGVYTILVNNTLGTAPTSGAITVTDTLPAGLAFVSAAGTGWSCLHASGTVTCTSSTVIGAGATSPNPITLTVAVGPTAAPNVTNTATVSGGGEPAVNNGNNSASDYTVVALAGSNTFQPDGNQAALPGSSVFYPHTFVAGLAGTVTFSTATSQSPVVPGWTQVIYRDTNCNGVLDGGETAAPLTTGVAVVPGDRVCIVVADNVPLAAPYNAVNVITVTATFTGPLTYTRTDTTTVGSAGGAGLTLAKAVRNVTLGGAAGTSNTARPNDVLEYTVTYTNGGSGALNTIVITDATPAFTTFQSATCTAPLPANLTACSATTQPGVGATGAIAWTLTGSLAPGATGSVVFVVRVNP
jgi:uncharacterized repeat protein (TIGR01451 family)